MIASIAGFKIENEPSHGGSGDVFPAIDRNTGRKVAIKVFKSAVDPYEVRRVQQEILAIGSMHHKNIVTIYGSGLENGIPFLVMEFLEGQTLRTVIQSQKLLTLLQRVSIMTQAAEGLAYLHSKGFVHRDVRPENIMLLADGSVKVMGLGISLAADRTESITLAGQFTGTTIYSAPEQLEGVVSAQTDIFSLGVVYYELLTGRHPFKHSNQNRAALAMAILSVDPPAVSQLSTGCPEALELLVHKMIAKDRRLRYATFEQFLVDTKPILVDLQRRSAGALLAALQRLSTHLSISDQDLARLLHASTETIVNWKSGENAMPIKMETRVMAADTALGRMLAIFRPERLPDVIRQKVELFQGRSALDLILDGRIEEVADLYDAAFAYQG
jgi:serine/threonine-protein kinase